MRAEATTREQLGKLGNTLYAARRVRIALHQPWFLPAAVLNQLRRDGIAMLSAARAAAFAPLPRALPVEPPEDDAVVRPRRSLERWNVGHGAEPMLRRLLGDDSTPGGLLVAKLCALAPVVKKKLVSLGDEVPWYPSDAIDRLWRARRFAAVVKVAPDEWFTARTLEDCLCEYRKYAEVREGTRTNRPYPDKLGRWA